MCMFTLCPKVHSQYKYNGLIVLVRFTDLYRFGPLFGVNTTPTVSFDSASSIIQCDCLGEGSSEKDCLFQQPKQKSSQSGIDCYSWVQTIYYVVLPFQPNVLS